MQTIQTIDSHTGGEPTRIVVAGGPELGDGPLTDRVARFRDENDHIRSAIIHEPRGSEVLVGGLLVPPHEQDCDFGVIFFNNTGYLGMCGHGTIGLMVTLAFQNRIPAGKCRIDTPAGVVEAEMLDDHRVRVQNVESWLYRRAVPVDIPGHGTVTGDIAWGGNWFYLSEDHGQSLSSGNSAALTAFGLRVRAALEAAEITGAGGGVIDHIELCGAPEHPDSNCRNFVLCPGGAWDRSPCGTGTSARLACLAAEQQLAAGDTWRQESILGSVFEGSWQPSEATATAAAGPVITPTIIGAAWVTGETSLLLDPSDPFRFGIPAG